MREIREVDGKDVSSFSLASLFTSSSFSSSFHLFSLYKKHPSGCLLSSLFTWLFSCSPFSLILLNGKYINGCYRSSSPSSFSCSPFPFLVSSFCFLVILLLNLNTRCAGVRRLDIKRCERIFSPFLLTFSYFTLPPFFLILFLLSSSH